VRVRLTAPEHSREAGFKISSELGQPYWSRDWFDSNYNFFSAIEIEKIVIFIVLSFMIIVASFNISSTLFVSVLKRYQDISILKTLGAKQVTIVKIFVLQGLFMGMFGSVLGLIVGISLSKFVSRSSIINIPPDIYKFDHLPVEFRLADLLLILLVSFVICLISTLIPALRGAKLNPIEGLKYE
jgi:lipoprotein-releasing system permease protein